MSTQNAIFVLKNTEISILEYNIKLEKTCSAYMLILLFQYQHLYKVSKCS